MQNKFNCPACSALIEYDGQSSLFQNCSSCKALITIPSDFFVSANDTENATNNSNPVKSIVASIKNIFKSDAEPVQNNFDVDSLSSSNPQQNTVLSQVKDLLAQHRKIDAIKVYKEGFGVSLRTAKDAVDEIIRKADTEILLNSPTIDDAKLAKIKRELVNGNKINAIKLYFETYKVGLKEAKDAVDSLEKELNSHLVSSNEPNHNSTFILDGIKNELRKGNKINAIKIFREHFEVSLAISKDTVEAIERGENIDFSQFPKNQN